MVTPRVVIGKYADNVTFGLRVSLPGNDAFTGNSSSPGTFSFDSEWTDITQLHQIGLAAFRTNVPLISGGTTNGYQVTWPALGYIPFIEARENVSNVVYDDYFNGAIGCGGGIDATTYGANTFTVFGGSASIQLLYVVYKIAVPSQ